MNIALIISFLFLCVPVIAIVSGIYMLNRNKKVLIFVRKLIDMSSEYNQRRIAEYNYEYKCAYNWFLHKHTYNEFLYSNKSLELEEWFTEEELKEINR